MDAKPSRPRGSENNHQALHHRHKSTGNLAMAAAAAATAASTTMGMRGPARRAAFGDVTNMPKSTVGGLYTGKLPKVQTANGIPRATFINKENIPYSRGAKDQLARPAQRPNTASSNRPNLTVFADAGSKAVNSVAGQDAGAVVLSSAAAVPSKDPIPGSAAARPRTVYAPSDEEAAVPLSTTTLDVPPMQPRHHKSQPHLKPSLQPMLRRTQSKHFESLAEQAVEKIIGDESPAASPDSITIPASIVEEKTYAHLPYCADDDELLHQVNDVDAYPELSSKLDLISEEGHPIHNPAKEGHTQALSEPEEYWDEEEDEDYDDQDQAYTTAHSFPTQNMTMGGVTTILAPPVTSRIQRELEEAKLEVQRCRSSDDLEEEMWDVSMVAEYGEEIFEYMRELEIKMQPNPHYMEMQTEIQWTMRSVLMDWLVQVHNRFSLLPETLFLTVNYIDRFLSRKIVSIGKLQLVGATAILVASKYEEINCPSLEEIVYMVDGGYTTEEILKAERFMLSMLSFELGWPGPMSFLRRVSKADNYDLDTRTLAKYFLELTIMDERFVASPPSFLAAGAHCLSRLILNKGDWTKAHVHYSGYTWTQLRPLVTIMIECCEHPRRHHSAVFEKYQDQRFKEASTVVQHALDAGFTLPHHGTTVRPMRGQTADFSDALHYANGLLVSAEG
ncbi:related to cyclin B3 [Claviceps purpurea 20.1]|uniref:Related to cyclin B3 n=1 Tax=Claviceps purpurea (strain 20.1) TaxID=1111077 RepID=M1WA62_CLAP2|nr:hypothetical protein E4U37_001292 [Claviceps purpurea]CCE32860.1 related to cyclin B3 [Claviceps purpurea 20.1]KAG6216021.1 hypothetical protein E4U50_006630 [Claviceps purpurea]KAG6271379.1 hypothetical protein E4U49_004148 [Claviceps purpurea]KAG6286757.1 hypothetical protein E4U46_004592 [Claviceps purpurea]